MAISPSLAAFNQSMVNAKPAVTVTSSYNPSSGGGVNYNLGTVNLGGGSTKPATPATPTALPFNYNTGSAVLSGGGVPTAAQNAAAFNAYSAGGTTVTPNVSTNISTNTLTQPQITGTPDVKIPPPQVNTTAITQSALDFQKQMQDQIKTAQEQQLQGEQNTLKSQLAGMLNIQDQYNQDLTNARNQSGYYQKMQTVNDLNAQLQSDMYTTEAGKLTIGSAGGITNQQYQGEAARYDRERAVRSLTIGAQLAGAQGQLATAEKYISDAVEMKYKFTDTKLNILGTLLKDNQDTLKSIDDKKYKQAVMNFEAHKIDLQDQKERYSDILTLASSAAANGAPSLVMKQISDLGSDPSNDNRMKALQLAAPYMQDKLKAAQIAKTWADVAQSKAQIAALTASGGTMEAIAAPGANNIEKNINTVSTAAQSKVLTGTQQTKVATALSVLKALDSFATNNQSGRIAGVNPFSSLAGIDMFRQQDAIKNQALLETLNLNLQYWASGAALTEEQTKQIYRLAPSLGDTDRTTKIKANQLADYMLNDITANLGASGLKFKALPSDLFNTKVIGPDGKEYEITN